MLGALTIGLAEISEHAPVATDRLGGQPGSIETLSEALDRLAEHGFTEDFFARDGRLTCAGCTETFDPLQVEIVEIVRFEGVTDPDDEAVVFAIACGTSGPRGTYTVPFGISMPPDDAAVVDKLHRR